MLIACRRHWMYLYPRLVGLSLLAIVPAVVLTVGPGLGPGLDGTLLWIVIVVDAVWVAFWLVRLYFTWFRYNNDMWVVKNKRIVDSIRRHGFHHQMASAELIDVEDMATAKEGLLPTLFDFGDVRCQTEGPSRISSSPRFLDRQGCSGPSTPRGMPPARCSRALRSSSDAASRADALGRLARAGEAP